MYLSFVIADGSLHCVIGDPAAPVIVTSADPCTGANHWADALEDAAARGAGECFWPGATENYRWMFRRAGDKLRIAVLRSTGTLTGWEQVYWGECDAAPFFEQARAQAAAQLSGSARSPASSSSSS